MEQSDINGIHLVLIIVLGVCIVGLSIGMTKVSTKVEVMYEKGV